MTLPDGPQSAPLWQMAQWIFRPLEFLEACDRTYGEAFTLRMNKNTRPLVFFSAPDAIQQIFSAPHKQFDSGKGNSVLKPFLGKRSLEILDGRKHERQRQLLMPPFHGAKMRNFGQMMTEITTDVGKQWAINRPFKARPQVHLITFRLMCKTLLGFDQGDRFEQIRHLYDILFDNAIGTPINSLQLFLPSLQVNLGKHSPWGRFSRAKEELDRVLLEEIRERRAAFDPDRNDMLTMLMGAQDEKGQPLEDEDLHSEIKTLLLAAHETIAIAITWALYWIHTAPGVLSKVRQELDTLGLSPDPLEVSKLPYLTAVCQETLRIYPVGLISFPRIAKSPIEVAGYTLPKGTVITGCIYLTHQRPDLYPDPKSFRPERFLERQFSPYEYFPFGGGSRRCLGGAFAPFAMKVVVAQILAGWDLEVLNQRPVRPVRRGVTTAPKGGISMVVRKTH
jgi:cytochrome P450 family 110